MPVQVARCGKRLGAGGPAMRLSTALGHDRGIGGVAALRDAPKAGAGGFWCRSGLRAAVQRVSSNSGPGTSLVRVTTDPAEPLCAARPGIAGPPRRGRPRSAAGAAAGAGSGLALAEALRREYPADLVAAAMAQHDLRKAAAAKFSRAADMLFTRAGYEQASSEAVAAYRAGRLRGAARIADLCCGIGGDLIALAATADVLAVDRDAVHACLARYNAAAAGRAGRVTVLVFDVRDVPLAGLDAVFIDPAPFRPGHRLGGRRPPVPCRGLRTPANLVRRADCPGRSGLRQGRTRDPGRGGAARLGGRVSSPRAVISRRPRPSGRFERWPPPPADTRTARAAPPSCPRPKQAPRQAPLSSAGPGRAVR